MLQNIKYERQYFNDTKIKKTQFIAIQKWGRISTFTTE